MKPLLYPDGKDVRAGDLFESEEGQTDRIVVVVDTMEAVAGYNAQDWAYLGTGVLLECKNASRTVTIPTKNPAFAGSFVHRRTSADVLLVEAAGIEPASEGVTSPALHA